MRKEDMKMQKNYDFKKVELEMQNFWREAKLYAFDPNSKKPIYSIDTPPPTVNGSLHIGHIFSYTQAEMIARFRRMQGCEVYYPFGFDDNGLPTERLVERVLGIRANEMPRTDFIHACMETTKGYEEDFKALWLSLGFSCDWSLQYETISAQVQALSQKSFIDLYKMGKAYQKTSPVLWCTECQTSIAQAELDTHACETQFYTLKFQLAENAHRPLLIATTRPELLGACVSLFVHPEDARYSELIGKSAYVPLYDTLIPILGEDTVEMEKGTGIVMCATYGDAMDVEWVQKHNLPDRTWIDAKGHITAEDPYLSGLSVIKARKVIIERLSETGTHILSLTVGGHAGVVLASTYVNAGGVRINLFPLLVEANLFLFLLSNRCSCNITFHTVVLSGFGPRMREEGTLLNGIAPLAFVAGGASPMNYSHCSEPSLRTGTKAPLEIRS